MGMGCGMSLVKYILFVFNLLCALCGMALIAIGIVYLLEFKDLDRMVKDAGVVLAVPIFLIVLGIVIFVIAFFGCCGAIRESHCMTMTYSVCLMVLIIAQIALGALVISKSGDIKTAFNKGFDELWNGRNTSNGNKDVINLIQETLKCCGNSGSTDYGSLTLPDSCCTNPIADMCSIGQAHPGCHSVVGEFAHKSSSILGYVILGVAGIELLGFIFACCLANSIRNQERRYA